MSAATAIGRVGESLQQVLVRHMQVDPPVGVTLLAPDEPGAARRVNLFLYEIDENPYLRNLDPQIRPGTTHLAAPPLSLTLSYMLTAYAPTDQQSGNSAAHQLLGAAMQVLHDHPVLPRDVLIGDLAGARERVRVVHVPRTVAEATQLWNAIDQPYRTSVFYEVSVVQIDSTTAVGDVPPRVRSVAVDGPRSSYRPPSVTAMSVTGSDLRFKGEHLRGWRATVTMTGHTLLHRPLEDDTFSATLPPGLDPGLHEVRVDVAEEFRRTFLLEVP